MMSQAINTVIGSSALLCYVLYDLLYMICNMQSSLSAIYKIELKHHFLGTVDTYLKKNFLDLRRNLRDYVVNSIQIVLVDDEKSTV